MKFNLYGMNQVVEIVEPEAEKALISLLNAGFAFGALHSDEKPATLRVMIYQYDTDVLVMSSECALDADLAAEISKLILSPDAKPGMLRHIARRALERVGNEIDTNRAEEA